LGIVPPDEISGQKEDLAEGAKVLSSVIEPENEDGYVILSLKRADKKKALWNLEKKHEQKKTLTVKVLDANRGGLIVGEENYQGFLPVSELSREHYPRVEGGDREKILAKLNELINKELTVKVLAFDRNEDKLIFSEKKAIGALDKGSLDKIKIGQKIATKISGVADFGLFVQFDDLEGLVHISEISWDRIEDIHKEFKAGDEVKAKVIDIDPDRQRISLSIKRLTEDPWQKKVKKYRVGQIVEGQISQLTPFGAFLTFDQDVKGLVHISEISHQRVNDPADKLVLGDKTKAKIISIEPEEHKIGLSLKELKSKSLAKKRKPEQGIKEKKLEKKTVQKRVGSKKVGPKKIASKSSKSSKSSKEKKPDLKELVTSSTYQKLSKGGLKTLANLKKQEKKDLLKIKGIGKKTAEKILRLRKS
jgi:small subunit ribosomal protein S1